MRAGGSKRLSVAAMSRSRDVGDLLADELAFGTDAQKYLPTVAVQEPAQCLTRALQLRRRALEFERLGFALGDDRLDRSKRGHGSAVSSTGRKRPPPK